MATLPIDYFLGYGGSVSWNTIVLNWDGTGTTWTVFDLSDNSVVYTGTGKAFTVSADPSQRYDFRISTTVSSVVHTMDIMVYTTVLPAPVNLRASLIDDTSAYLSWSPVPDAMFYEIADVADSYSIIETVYDDAFFTEIELSDSTRYSRAVRTSYNAEYSRWSAPVTFFTKPSPTVAAGVYLFRPATVYVWADGRAGSSDPGWKSGASDWYHGDGYEWGDVSGVQTTYFFYGVGNPFASLQGATPTKTEVYLARAATSGDPGIVLSRWGLHTYAEKPIGEPTPSVAEADTGSFTRGQGGWIEIPNDWAVSLAEGDHAGIYWGDVSQRFQMAPQYDLEISPRTGDIRVTVG